MRLLSRREHSRLELQQKLQVRGFDADIVEPVLDALVDDGWQSDRRFAESFLRQRIAQGFGPARLAQELRQRGVGDECFREQLTALEVDWDLLLEEVYRKKFRGFIPESLLDVGKCARFLQYRGFPSDQVRSFLDRLKQMGE